MTIASVVLDRLVSSLDGERLGAYGVHVLIGEDTAQHRWRSDDRKSIYSASKGVCPLALGMAIDEGILSLETPVPELLPQTQLGSGIDTVTVRYLLTESSGIDFSWFSDEPAPWADLAQEMPGRPAFEPGSVFQYSDASTYVAMRMLGGAVGDVRDWLVPRLFDPLGIHNPQWHRCPRGCIVGGSGFELRTEELSRIGHVLRDRGRWGGRQLVDGAGSSGCASRRWKPGAMRHLSRTVSRCGSGWQIVETGRQVRTIRPGRCRPRRGGDHHRP